MDRGQALRAIGIFLLSLAVALVVGFSLGAFVPEPPCAFPVVLDRTMTEAGVEATVSEVDGSYAVDVIGYKAVLFEGEERRVIQEGNLTDLSPVSPGLSFHPADATSDLLQTGDRFLLTLDGEVHLLLDEGGTPIGWTLGCEL
ncbi:MAG: hypothetical protein ACE5EW_07150 [Thermoplasmata archaeon]